MSKVFTDENGKKWRAWVDESDISHYRCLLIEPIPAPPPTEEDILEEMDREIKEIGYAGTMCLLARAIIKAVRKLREVGK